MEKKEVLPGGGGGPGPGENGVLFFRTCLEKSEIPLALPMGVVYRSHDLRKGRPFIQ